MFKLPDGFNSVKKIMFLADSNRLALLSEGQVVIVSLNERGLKIEFSIKLPCRAVIDFDIDHMCNYVLIVSSEGDVTLYDLEKAAISEAEITNSKLRLASRDTLSHHKFFT